MIRFARWEDVEPMRLCLRSVGWFRFVGWFYLVDCFEFLLVLLLICGPSPIST